MRDTRYIVRYVLEILSTGPLKIGDGENEVLLDAYSGKPQLPATGIAGAFRNYLTVNIDDRDGLQRLFGGAEGKKSRLFLEDGEYLGNEIQMEQRERVRLNGVTGTAAIGGKFQVNSLAAGQKFRVAFNLDVSNLEEKEKFSGWLEEAFRALNEGVIRLGAQKTNGEGGFQILTATRMEYDLCNPEDLKKYLRRDESHKENILQELQKSPKGRKVAVFEIDAETVTPLLIAGVRGTEKDKAGKTPMKNASGEYIVPGSSFKGILRMQCERIAEYLGLPKRTVEDIFGSSAEAARNHEERRAGKLYAEDALIQDVKDAVVYNRIAVDKFTAGVRMGGKFNARPLEGKFQIRLSLMDAGEHRKAHIGLILLALRDIFSERVSMGSGNNIGYGRIHGNPISLQDGENNIMIPTDGPGGPELEEYVKVLLAERQEIQETHNE